MYEKSIEKCQSMGWDQIMESYLTKNQLNCTYQLRRIVSADELVHFRV
jgi:hypothetical protein